MLRFRGHLDSGLGLAPVRMTLPGYDSSIGGSEMSSQRYSPEFKDEAKDRKFYRVGAAGCVEEGRGVQAGRLGMLSVTVVAYRRSGDFCLEKTVKISINQTSISMNS